jgi:zinc-ribbon family
MFFLIGVRTKAKAIGQTQRGCTKCTRPTVHTAVEVRRWLTLFFIPVIPLGGNSYVVRCNLCGLSLKASPEIKSQLNIQAMAAKA